MSLHCLRINANNRNFDYIRFWKIENLPPSFTLKVNLFWKASPITTHEDRRDFEASKSTEITSLLNEKSSVYFAKTVIHSDYTLLLLFIDCNKNKLLMWMSYHVNKPYYFSDVFCGFLFFRWLCILAGKLTIRKVSWNCNLIRLFIEPYEKFKGYLKIALFCTVEFYGQSEHIEIFEKLRLDELSRLFIFLFGGKIVIISILNDTFAGKSNSYLTFESS